MKTTSVLVSLLAACLLTTCEATSSHRELVEWVMRQLNCAPKSMSLESVVIDFWLFLSHCYPQPMLQPTHPLWHLHRQSQRLQLRLRPRERTSSAMRYRHRRPPNAVTCRAWKVTRTITNKSTAVAHLVPVEWLVRPWLVWPWWRLRSQWVHVVSGCASTRRVRSCRVIPRRVWMPRWRHPLRWKIEVRLKMNKEWMGLTRIVSRFKRGHCSSFIYVLMPPFTPTNVKDHNLFLMHIHQLSFMI